MYGREIDGQPVEFGTTGYTNDNIFVLYDRTTDSVWYPLGDNALDAISGPLKGQKIEFLEKPVRMPLLAWVNKHPDSLVLLPPPESKTVRDLQSENAQPPAADETE